jgi:hypothetical protein
MPNALEEIQKPDRDLVEELVAGGPPELLQQLFKSRASRWKHYFITGDFHSSTLFSDLERGITGNRAFDLIPAAVQIALDQENDDRFATALGLLHGLAKSSDTTEVPETLDQNWSTLKRRVETRLTDHTHGPLYWDELARWYRRGDLVGN